MHIVREATPRATCKARSVLCFFSDRQTDRQTDGQRDRQADRQKDRQTERQTHADTYTQTDRQTHRHTDTRARARRHTRRTVLLKITVLADFRATSLAKNKSHTVTQNKEFQHSPPSSLDRPWPPVAAPGHGRSHAVIMNKQANEVSPYHFWTCARYTPFWLKLLLIQLGC